MDGDQKIGSKDWLALGKKVLVALKAFNMHHLEISIIYLNISQYTLMLFVFSSY